MSAPTSADPHRTEDLLHPDHHHIKKHVRAYLLVGSLLFIFTAITVGLSYVDFGSLNRNIVIALLVATFKAGLVAAIFMHLNAERKTIYLILGLTVFFVIQLFLLTWLHFSDPIHL